MATVQDAESALIESVCERVRERVAPEEVAEAEAFVRSYYRRAPAADLAGREPVDLYGAALAHWTFGRDRQQGEPRVRVYNPTFEQHGWQSPHTAIEIVSDDMPFLVDSVSMELSRRELGIHVLVHPVVGDESYMHIEVDRQAEGFDELGEALRGVLEGVRVVVDDWRPMRDRMQSLVEELESAPPAGVEPAEADEARAFLAWLADHHFTFLGYREYALDADTLRGVEGTGLGLLHGEVRGHVSTAYAKLPPAVRALAREPHVLVLTKANARSPIHRPSYLDYVGVKRFDDDGNVTGEHRFLGLYTTAAYREVSANIPVLRRKAQAVRDRAGFPPGSHDDKALVEIIDTFPRDELIQMEVDELDRIARGILELGERQRVRLFMRADRYERFVSLPRVPPARPLQHGQPDPGRRDPARRARRRDRRLGPAAHRVGARAHPLHAPRPRRPAGVRRRRARSEDRRGDPRLGRRPPGGVAGGVRRGARHGALPALRVRVPGRLPRRPAGALGDRRRAADRGARGRRGARHQPLPAAGGGVRARCAASSTAAASACRCPTCCRCSRSLGLTVTDERPYRVTPRDGAPVWIYDFGLEAKGPVDADAIRERFHEGFARVWRGEAEQDGFNGLIVGAGLDWREVTMVRAVARYLRQAGIPFSDRYMEETLIAHAGVAAKLSELFHARFDPDGDRSRAEDVGREIEEAIDAVDSLDQDRILRGFLSVVRAMLRTNYFLPGPKPYVSFKLDPTQVPLTPLPRPRYEIFVHSPRVEGVHLRGGSVARGGLRWSDRREDFRTEILGLMKAQMVKNALIVPVGAKGGFVVKRAGDQVVECYTTFISGLLDITDTISGGEIVPPAHVVRHDGDDPYLVVAADKGTATFSDIANGVAEEYGFWLGDAFASGGSVGYDHKAMGITARSAWVSVQRHFRELGVDVQAEDFRVAGRRRHERGRVRQRHAAVRAHPARRGVRSPARVPRSDAGRGGRVRGARGGCSSCRARRGTTTPAS